MGVDDELYVVFKDGTSDRRQLDIHHAVGSEVLATMFSPLVQVIKVPKGRSAADLQAAYAGYAEVETVKPNYTLKEPGQK